MEWRWSGNGVEMELGVELELGNSNNNNNNKNNNNDNDEVLSVPLLGIPLTAHTVLALVLISVAVVMYAQNPVQSQTRATEKSSNVSKV